MSQFLDLNAAGTAENETIQETSSQNAAQSEFLQLRDELIKEFKEFLPSFQKYVIENNLQFY